MRSVILLAFAFAWYTARVFSNEQGLTLRHLEGEEEEEEEDDDGVCKEDYNFKHPHPCHLDVNNSCAFIVKWRKMEDMSEGWVEFDVMATLPPNAQSSSVWMALGFSPTSKMGGTDVITCWKTNNGSFHIHDGYNKPDGHTFVLDSDDGDEEEVQLRIINIHIEDRSFHCKFQRRINTGDHLQDEDLRTKQFVFVASGLLGKEHLMMLEQSSHVMSTCACNVTSCSKKCSCSGGIFYQFLKLHGILMSICFMLVIPSGAILSRYYKVVFANSWFKAHVTTVGIGVLWSIIGFGLVLTHTRGKFSVGYHQLLGVSCLGLIVIQPLVAYFRPPDKLTTKRRIFNIFHRSVAASILLISTVVLFLGVYIFHNEVMNFMYGILGIYVIINVSFVVLLEYLMRNHNFYTSPPVGYHKVTRKEELSVSESEDEIFVKDDEPKTMYKLEKGLLILFLIQNLILTILIGSLIYYFDAAD